MNLRTYGSAPFHVKVKFQALPGIELLPPKVKPSILAGDGVYEETWLAPHQWRREVTLADYHAVEVQSDQGRKMRASSDYVPSRVVMLLDALLNPVSRYQLSPGLLEHSTHWKIENLSAGTQPVVRIVTSASKSNFLTTGTAYVFLPGGLLIQSNENDIITTWSDDTLFAGKVAARHISIQAGAKRDLLTADLTIEPAGRVDDAAFDLPGDPAEPGMTLRPLHVYEVKPPTSRSGGPSWASTGQASPADLILHGFVDRHGVPRDLELISLQAHEKTIQTDDVQQFAQQLMDVNRNGKYRPAEIDGNPCQVAWNPTWVSH